MFRFRRLAPALLLGALAISVSACGTKSDGVNKSSKAAEVAKVEIGSDLFLKMPIPKTPVGAISAAWPPSASTQPAVRKPTAVFPEPTSPWIRRFMG